MTEARGHEAASGDPAAAWREFCRRIAEAGAAALADPMAAGARNQAEGLRCLSRQVVFALQHAVEFRDPDFPAFHRFDDDVTKWGGPNADNQYLRCAIDPDGLYRLTADVSGCRDAILSLSDGDMPLGHYGVFGECSLRDLHIDDGRLEVMIGPDRPEGAADWMATNPTVRQLVIRVYVCDWSADAIPDFYIERLDRPSDRPSRLTVGRMAEALEEAAGWVEASVPFWLRLIEGFRQNNTDNVLPPPRPAAGGADNIAYGGGFWDLGPDDAWLVSFEPPEALTWSIQTHTWPWFESGDLAHAQTSLNDTQAHTDRDGVVRAVVSHTDPGVPNWIDTEGRPVGVCIYRWIGASSMPAADSVVIPLAELRQHLPADHPTVTSDERRRQLDTRRRGVHRRFRR